MDSATGLVGALRERTRVLHHRAERTGVIRALLRGSASRQAYALLLRNLYPAYREMERGLERYWDLPAVRAVARPALYRSRALIADLERLGGASWRRDLALLPAGRRYRDHIKAVAADDGRLLVAHAYVRYFGDLSGGQILKRLLSRTLGLGPRELQFYSFPEIGDLDGFKAELGAALDRAAGEIGDPEATLEQAARSFELTIEVSEAVHDVALAGLAVDGVAPASRAPLEAS